MRYFILALEMRLRSLMQMIRNSNYVVYHLREIYQHPVDYHSVFIIHVSL